MKLFVKRQPYVFSLPNEIIDVSTDIMPTGHLFFTECIKGLLTKCTLDQYVARLLLACKMV